MDFALLDRLAARQHGLVTHRQLLEHGVTRPTLTRWTAAGRLVAVRRGVFRMPGSPVTQDQAWLAAVLAARIPALLSHGSAAAAWRLKGFELPDRIDVLSTGGRVRIAGLRHHQTAWLPERDRTSLRRIPITTVERTIVDASGLVSRWTLERAVDDSLRRRLVHLPRLVQCFEDVPVSGQRPSRALRRALAERVPGFDPGDSDAELDVMRVLRASSLPLPVQQHQVTVEGRRFRLDFAWPDTRHALEFDSIEYHGAVSSFHADRERMRLLQRADWTVWPVTERTSANELLAIALVATEHLR